MVRKFLILVCFFVGAYFFLATKGTGKIPFDLDYFSPLTQSFLHGRMDIPNPIVKTDLSFFQGKWYLYWGPLPAILLIPGQLVLHRFFPPVYLSILIAGLSMFVVYLILRRLKEKYVGKDLKPINMLGYLLFFAFGTNFLYIVTRSGVWDVAQTVAFLPSALAVYILLKKDLKLRDYFFAAVFISMNLIGRYSIALYAVFLLFRIIDNGRFDLEKIGKRMLVCAIPFAFFFSIFALYNYARFHNPLDFGFRYQVFDNFNYAAIAPQGRYSAYYVPRNLFYMFLEIPKFTFLRNGQVFFDWNPWGMSIFFVSPVLLAAFLTLNSELLHVRNFLNRLKLYLWVQIAIQVAVLVPIDSLGPLQIGMRHATDFTLLFLILAILGLKGKINFLVICGCVIAIALNVFALYVA